MGLYAHTAGKAFEQVVELQHKEYRREGLAWVEKTYPSTVTVRNGDHKRTFQKGPALPDYVGVLKGGRAVLIEAKSWKAEDRHRHRKAAHQAVALQEWAKLRAVCGYLVEWRRRVGVDVRWYWIDHLKLVVDETGLWIEFLRERGTKLEGVDWLGPVGRVIRGNVVPGVGHDDG